ncbi:hypothetical protein K466DRAFT_592823 [Polyporus arcularius HHB13444]|uniref:Uncharacterized protein n=1 Tax=Polyporus arcularius HHB13444 TaxID=1314778 RepID=A0A5C3NPV7_9APHY|nr:hypothetical protein K466DRAFT_592823 [Polyporus arcularius HHB13444]
MNTLSSTPAVPHRSDKVENRLKSSISLVSRPRLRLAAAAAAAHRPSGCGSQAVSGTCSVARAHPGSLAAIAVVPSLLAAPCCCAEKPNIRHTYISPPTTLLSRSDLQHPLSAPSRTERAPPGADLRRSTVTQPRFRCDFMDPRGAPRLPASSRVGLLCDLCRERAYGLGRTDDRFSAPSGVFEYSTERRAVLWSDK